MISLGSLQLGFMPGNLENLCFVTLYWRSYHGCVWDNQLKLAVVCLGILLMLKTEYGDEDQIRQMIENTEGSIQKP